MATKEIPDSMDNIYSEPIQWHIGDVRARTLRGDLRMAEYTGPPEEVWAVFARDIRKGKYEGCIVYGAQARPDVENENEDVLVVTFDPMHSRLGPTWGKTESPLAKLGLSPAEKREWASKGFPR